MAQLSAVELDKTWKAGVGVDDSYGTITIRVVVVPPKENKEGAVVIDPEDPILESGSGPLDSYLEKPRGAGYVVLLVNGQRHDTLDESFVHRELGFKYLRTRTMIVVDVDGLAADAISQLVQGSRQGMFRGKVYSAILDRCGAVLKKDPDLMRLESDAEQKIAELSSGDETIRRKLDELIDGHHTSADHAIPGTGAKGVQAGLTGLPTNEVKERDVVINADHETGEPGELPVLVAEPDSHVVRLYPDEERAITVRALPAEQWGNLESKEAKVIPSIPELQIGIGETAGAAILKLRFCEPGEMENEDYPIKARLIFTATFEGKSEPRIVERDLVIVQKKDRKPRPKPELRPDPTYLKVVTRQPVQLVPGGPSLHVRLRWDGEDSLASGSPPAWMFSAKCASLEAFPTPIFSKPRAGDFELLLDTPHGLLPGQQLEFVVEAFGPGDVRLSAIFAGEVVEPAPGLEPRKTKEQIAAGATQRRPPYELKIVKQGQWDTTPCWASGKWTKNDVGCLEEPTASTLLTLIVNEDAEILKQAHEQMMAKQLDENTVKERLGRYTAHIYFHLFKMYEYAQAVKKQHEEDDTIHLPTEAELRGEINRVGITLASLMDR
jgi:hypothetical protein